MYKRGTMDVADGVVTDKHTDRHTKKQQLPYPSCMFRGLTIPDET